MFALWAICLGWWCHCCPNSVTFFLLLRGGCLNWHWGVSSGHSIGSTKTWSPLSLMANIDFLGISTWWVGKLSLNWQTKLEKMSNVPKNLLSQKKLTTIKKFQQTIKLIAVSQLWNPFPKIPVIIIILEPLRWQKDIPITSQWGNGNMTSAGLLEGRKW